MGQPPSSALGLLCCPRTTTRPPVSRPIRRFPNNISMINSQPDSGRKRKRPMLPAAFFRRVRTTPYGPARDRRDRRPPRRADRATQDPGRRTPGARRQTGRSPGRAHRVQYPRPLPDRCPARRNPPATGTGCRPRQCPTPTCRPQRYGAVRIVQLRVDEPFRMHAGVGLGRPSPPRSSGPSGKGPQPEIAAIMTGREDPLNFPVSQVT